MENSDFHVDPYEGEETLSLCDLPNYSDDASNWNDYCKEEQRLSSVDNDFFEFFSEDFTASTCSAATANNTNNNIIFCGKLIPYKQLSNPEKPQNSESNNTEQNQTKKASFLRWKSLSFSKKKSSSKGSKAQEYDKASNTLAILPSSKSYVYATKNCDFSVGKASVLAPPEKSRWYLFLFGIGRLPTEMELRDIKTRQSRLIRRQSTMIRSVECDEMVKGNGRKRWKGLWKLLRVLGCKTQQTNFVVKASGGCIPHV